MTSHNQQLAVIITLVGLCLYSASMAMTASPANSYWCSLSIYCRRLTDSAARAGCTVEVQSAHPHLAWHYNMAVQEATFESQAD